MYTTFQASQEVLVVKKLPANARDIRDAHSTPRLGRSLGGVHSNPLQYSSWRIPLTEEPGGLSSLESQGVKQD